MEEVKSKSEKLTDHIGEYLDTYYKLTVLNVTEKLSVISSGSFLAMALCILAGLVLFFLGIGTAMWIGNAIKNHVAGYFIVGGFFILLMGIMFLLRNKIVFPMIRNIVVRKIYE